MKVEDQKSKELKISAKERPFDKQKNPTAVRYWENLQRQILEKAKDDPENWSDMFV